MRGALVAKSWPTPDLLLSPDSPMWQDTGRSVAAAANNDPVATWDDLAGTNNRVQGTTTKRPLLKTNLLNGYRGLDFDGTDDTLLGAITARTASTWYLVAKKKAAVGATTKPLLGIRVTTANYTHLFTNSTVGTGYSYYPTEAAGNVHIGGVPTNWNVICLNFESLASATFRIGGGAGVNFNPHDNHGSATLDATAGSVTGVATGDYQIVAIRRYPTSHAAGDMNLVGGWLAQKYGLTWDTV